MKTFKFMKQNTLFMVLILSVLFLNAKMENKIEINKTFKVKEIVKIQILSGDCEVLKGTNNEIKVHVIHNFSKGDFEPIMKEEGNSLILEEKFKSSSKDKNRNAHWKVFVPENTTIDINSVSGDFNVSGIKKEITVKLASGDLNGKNLMGNIKVKAANGDIVLSDSKGEFNINAASGDIQMKNLKGTFKLKADSGDIQLKKVSGSFDLNLASGDLEASDIDFQKASTVNTVAGDTRIVLSQSPKVNLELKTVSGELTLDFNGNPVNGSFSFKGMKGNIHSDIPFDKDEEKESNTSPFTSKSINKGNTPKITLKSVSGELTLKK